MSWLSGVKRRLVVVMWRATVSTLLVLSLSCGGGGAVDLTLKVNATGSVVVDAVVDLITQSCLFISDRLMLRRIAYAETTDGAADFTFTQGGGIWQVYNVTDYRLVSVFTACRIASAVLATAIPSVRLSVCPSHAGIVSKRRHVALYSLHGQIAKCV